MEIDKWCNMWQKDTSKIKREVYKTRPSSFKVWRCGLGFKEDIWASDLFHRKPGLWSWMSAISKKDHMRNVYVWDICTWVQQMKNEGNRERGWLKEKLWDVIREDMLACDEIEDMALNRALWRERTCRAVTGKIEGEKWLLCSFHMDILKSEWPQII